ncbi:MAG: LAGLIDADG family homing endonuclease [Candidatus Paceibacterota bacterium]|jgi:hypothetical protein
MGKRGPKPKGVVDTKWSADLAYAIGLLSSDGCLSSDGRHITLVSKDEEQIVNFLNCLKIELKIGKTYNGSKDKRVYYRVQVGDVLFYNFLLELGLASAKSKTISSLKIPDKYFFDFLRGSFDGDGCFYSYWDPRWKSSFMFYTSFISASKEHINWLRDEIFKRLKIKGHITKAKKMNIYYQLKYAKSDSLKVLRKIYQPNKVVVCLSRKRLKIDQALGIIGNSL